MRSDPAAGRRFRAPFGILEAALLLVVVGMAAWVLTPVPAARQAADAEKSVVEALRAVADAEQARGSAGGPYLPLDPLVAANSSLADRLEATGFRPSGTPGVLGSRTHWITVLLPDREGSPVPPAAADPANARRGFLALAWPRPGASAVLRALAALPGGVLWQHLDEPSSRGDPGSPPIPALAFPSEPGRVPPAPFDWTVTQRRTP